MQLFPFFFFPFFFFYQISTSKHNLLRLHNRAATECCVVLSVQYCMCIYSVPWILYPAITRIAIGTWFTVQFYPFFYFETFRCDPPCLIHGYTEPLNIPLAPLWRPDFDQICCKSSWWISHLLKLKFHHHLWHTSLCHPQAKLSHNILQSFKMIAGCMDLIEFRYSMEEERHSRNENPTLKYQKVSVFMWTMTQQSST